MTTAPVHAGRAHASRPPLSMKSVDFRQAPFLVIWETTQACALACRHCRASARPWRDPLELTTEEGRRVVRQTAEMGTPLIVFSGGDPVSRPDLALLIAEGNANGLRTATIPAATDALTAELVGRLRDAGLDQLALSLDFPDAALHDAFRGVPGAFEKTMRAVAWAHGAGLPLQINTTLCADTVPYLERMASFVDSLGIVFWEVFFLVPTGRGTAMGGLRPEECERLFALLHRVQEKGSFIVKVTEAPHYRRHVAQQVRHAMGHRGRPHGAVEMPSLLTTSEGPGHTVGLAPRGVNAGNGFLFVSHRGEVFPSGFLPLRAGSVRERHLADIYRNAPLLRALREPDMLKGRCGECEFREICGGSRSRAYALTGDPFATDPWCAYQPARTEAARAETAPAS
jgi:AdoMet-dependent heme synthase